MNQETGHMVGIASGVDEIEQCVALSKGRKEGREGKREIEMKIREKEERRREAGLRREGSKKAGDVNKTRLRQGHLLFFRV